MKDARHPRDLGSIGIDELFGKAVELTGGDVFKALMVCHNTLRVVPRKGVEEGMLAPYRKDGGDQTGARYHIFGTAAYAFAHRHWYHDDPGGGFFPPEKVVEIEEGFWSQDVIRDNVEFAVDLQGIEIGRQLYDQVIGKSRDQLAQQYRIDPKAVCKKATPTQESTSKPTTTQAKEGASGGISFTKEELEELPESPIIETNEMSLEFDPGGGPVTGRLRFVYTEQVKAGCPRTKTTWDLTLKGDYSGSSMSGTFEGLHAGWYSSSGCPKNLDEQLIGSWDARVSGSSVVGTITVQTANGEPAPHYKLPFEVRTPSE